MSNNYLQNIEKTRNTKEQLSFYEQLTDFIETSNEPLLSKFRAFSVYTPRQAVTVFLERYEVFKLIKNTPGSIVECGVGSGQGLMAFAHFCSIFEPYHYTRKIIGFDTFEGFKGITDKDKTSKATHMVEGGLVLWIPLFDCTPEDGSLEVCIGSHKQGMIEHDSFYANPELKRHLRTFVNDDITKQYQQHTMNVKRGSVTVQHFSLLHRSGSNIRQNRVRYTMLARCSNLLASDFLPISWK
jgi:hypothetical protein